jgi:hypothetical protein
MEGGGFYNRHSAMQAQGIGGLMPLWRDACATAGLDGDVLTIADFGSSQGRNSMAPIGIAIEALRQRKDFDIPIEVFHTDLPSNDFAALFEALHLDPASYLKIGPGIFPAAIGRSYFEPLFPAGRLHLGWNTWTAQWLSRNPAPEGDHILAGMIGEARLLTEVRRQSAADWRRFLEVRGLEMRSGAKLLTAFTARDDEETGWEWLLGALWASAKDLAAQGQLSERDCARMTIPINLRTVSDVREPFESGDAPGGLELLHVELARVPDPIWRDFAQSKNARALAQRQSDTTRAWAGPSLAACLGNGQTAKATIDELFARLTERLEADPRKHEPYMVVAVLSKR